MTSERMASSVARPPALRITCASPSAKPAYFDGCKRASMHVRMANRRAGGSGSLPLSPKLAAYFSFAVSTSRKTLLMASLQNAQMDPYCTEPATGANKYFDLCLYEPLQKETPGLPGVNLHREEERLSKSRRDVRLRSPLERRRLGHALRRRARDEYLETLRPHSEPFALEQFQGSAAIGWNHGMGGLANG